MFQTITKRLFNVGYCLISAAVFAWLLRDHPHARLLPVISSFLFLAYMFILTIAIVKPSGFNLQAQPISLKRQRCLRRAALLLPLPAFVYFAAYCHAVSQAGQTTEVNWIYAPIARVEKACFGKHRSMAFIRQVYVPLRMAMWKSESLGDTVSADSYRKTVIRLEKKYFGSSVVSR